MGVLWGSSFPLFCLGFSGNGIVPSTFRVALLPGANPLETPSETQSELYFMTPLGASPSHQVGKLTHQGVSLRTGH